MPKKTILYTDQINFLAQDGTHELLKAISYHRGSRGTIADPARDFLDAGIRRFIENLDPRELKRFNEILDSVKIAHQS